MGGRAGGWTIEHGELEDCLSFYVILLIRIEMRSPLESCLGPLSQEICTRVRLHV